MKQERTISAYKNYFMDFISSLRKEEARKIYYILDMLKVQERVNSKFVKYLREELYEIRAEYGGNIFRVFFIKPISIISQAKEAAGKYPHFWLAPNLEEPS